MRKRELDRLLRKWQAKLGLLDWTIDLKIEKKAKMPDLVGELEYVCEFRDATIRVREDAADKEAIIVHELLHCWTRQIRAARKENLVEEQALEAIGAALLGRKSG